MLNEVHVNSYKIYSSGEVDLIVQEVKNLNSKNIVIHIISFIHNTVLVQNLKKNLLKVFPELEVSLLKHDDKTHTVLNVYSLEDIKEDENIKDTILNQMYLDYLNKLESANNSRHQLFSRYFTDHLTNLPNVYQLRKDYQQNEEYGLVFIKIDNFLTINNFYGFVIGDFVIEEVARFLKETLDVHKLYRLTGSEFAFTLKESMNFYDLKIYLSELYEKIKSHFVLYQKIKIYIDFTMASTASDNSENIFSKVSMALDYAKQIGASFWIYEDRMNFENNYERNFELSEVVREGVYNSRIIPYFQAIVDNKTGNIVKYECLARLIDAEGNILSPVLFIPIAKKIKIYNEITIQMIEKSFLAFKDSTFEFNINLSIEDIMNSKIFNFIIEKVKNSKASSRVTFELLESEAIEDFKKVEHFITEVKRYGAKIAIDDFGSGYSNFSYLIKIRADYIKIDGSLIKNIDVDKSALLVVETIVSFAKKLGMKTVAEFVHSSVVMDKVKELEIDYSQGFYIDEPSLREYK
ncbi:bifunctional diguanylate cyclase/phosphodiesterase [Sulfurimonas sp. SAG-AH-194-L11]|nr:bifunctional diguanylate cyclase/phosphodiesterase [Sulfurimonas sp. SAG-AH-194-L11]MDF1877651.1 bifunctional diguanylate cyclase/phosphodiesterase [Sulfurimonas sp. SAG-AH-194-L11]